MLGPSGNVQKGGVTYCTAISCTILDIRMSPCQDRANRVVYCSASSILCGPPQAMPAVSCQACRVTQPCRRVNGKGHDKMIPSRWVRCGLLWNRLDRVSRVSRVMSTMSAVSASVVLWMNIGSSCRVWICVSVLGRVVCYRGRPVEQYLNHSLYRTLLDRRSMVRQKMKRVKDGQL